ncbi:MAG: manganese catalase family protein [Bacteroidaceae bacterium]|nr:manganese catalase family protein [Bacteroidaceae bacterium]MBQ3196559.1 manganese catalase family protein [Alistipes sp.]
MFYHIKELQFDARVSHPDPRFAQLLLEQFGGANGELSASMQYFLQAFACRAPYPDKYDMLMDIATEELCHLEIVGATIQMLLGRINGYMKDIDEDCVLTQMSNNTAKEELIHQALNNPQFLVISQGSPTLSNSVGVPWSSAYISGNGDLTVDLQSDMAAESRAKIVYESLIPFTDDPEVKRTLDFLMTREVTHFQQFQAALESFEPHFPPGIFETNPKYSNLYFNMSEGENYRGRWNKGRSAKLMEEWQYVEYPREYMRETNGMRDIKPEGTMRTIKSVKERDKKLAHKRSNEILDTIPERDMAWNKAERYHERELADY